ncbi:MAG: stage III sporulation protein AE [Oscillospiraceae bacterium]|nr:stage III sporulation protein AE [Oscillospiraceae bacterium]
MAVLLISVFILPCKAVEADLWQAVGGEELSKYARQYDAEIGDLRDIQLNDGIHQLANRAGEHLPEIIRTAAGSALTLLLTVVLCAVAQSLQPESGAGGINVSLMAGALAITALAANDMKSMMGLGRATIDTMQGFSQVLLPVMAACTAATGHAGAAAARQVATAMFCNIIITLIDRVLVKLVYLYLASCTAYVAIGNPGLKRISELIKWVVTKTLTVLVVIFVAYLTMVGAAAGSADAVALKATKTVIAGLIPVVGRIISDASETILVGAGALKNTVGIIGLIVVLSICLVPFLRLAAHYAAYRFSAALSATVADSRLWELIAGIGTAFGLILGMTGSCAMLMLVSMLTAVAGGG